MKRCFFTQEKIFLIIIMTKGYLFILLLSISNWQTNAAPPGEPSAVVNFKKFSTTLVQSSNLSLYVENGGATTWFPFGVGYMLANIQSQPQPWNVPKNGYSQVLNTPDNQIASDYISLVNKLRQRNIATNSVLYVKDKSKTQNVPEKLTSLQTQVEHSEFVTKWKESWTEMNGMVSNKTNGALNEKFIPKSRFLGAAFLPFTLAGHINTAYYKGAWQSKAESIGNQTFSYNESIPFNQIEGTFPFVTTSKYSAVAIELADKTKYVVFALPKNMSEFLNNDLNVLLSKSNPVDWGHGKQMKVEIPSMKLVSHIQHYINLESLGATNAFCTYPDVGKKSSKDNETEDIFVMHPIIQANYIQVTSDNFEVASATGATVNSEKERQMFLHGESPDEEPESESQIASNGSSKSQNSAKTNPSVGKSQSKQAKSGTSDVNAVKFNQPFFWYLYDKEMGPLFYGVVESFATPEVPSDFEWLPDVALVSMWNCR